MTRLPLVGAAVALVGAGLVLATMGSAHDDTANGSVPVRSLAEVTGEWRAVEGAGTLPAPLAAPVALLVEDGALSVATGCNRGRGTASVEGGRLRVDGLATTRMACPPPLDAQERWVLDMLQSGARLERSGPVLAVHWGEGERWWMAFRLAGSDVPTDGPSRTPESV